MIAQAQSDFHGLLSILEKGVPLVRLFVKKNSPPIEVSQQALSEECFSHHLICCCNLKTRQFFHARDQSAFKGLTVAKLKKRLGRQLKGLKKNTAGFFLKADWAQKEL